MPTLAELAAKNQKILIQCRCALTLTEREAHHLADRYGGDLSLEDLQTRLRCRRCGKRGLATIEIRDPWNPNILAMARGSQPGEVSKEHLRESKARDHARRRGRRNRLPEKVQAEIKAAAANLEKPKDV